MAMLSLASIQTDGGTQTRASIQQDAVNDYADAIEAGDKLPPVTVYHDGTTYWLADGFHRYAAHKKLGALELEADIRQGSRRDAVLHSVGANASHGLRRTNEDKRRAVQVLLADSEWRGWSDREIGRHAKVHHETVGRLRIDLTGENASERTYTTKHGTTTTMQIAGIGKPKAEPTPRPVLAYNPPLTPEQPEGDDRLEYEPDDDLAWLNNAPPVVVEAASQPMPRSTPYHDMTDALERQREPEVDKIGAHLSALLKAKDLAALIRSPLGVMHGLPNMWRLLQLEMQKEQADASKTITVN